MDIAVRARELFKRYGDKVAVDHISLEVAAGERVALVGPNGAGKTTTLLMILGVVTPDGGTVELVGRRLPEQRRSALAEVGFSAGYTPLAERLRVSEFLDTYGRLYGLRDPRPAIERGLAAFGISGLAGVMCTELSSGQRTLVGIVKATLHEPKLIVLDEPTASLDPEVARRVRSGLIEVSRARRTALLITSHNMLEIERLCDRVVFVFGGRVVADDSPDAVAAHYGRADLEDVFLHLASGGRIEPAPQETDRP